MNDYYMRGRTCPCARCRTRGLMGAAILITLGVLFLLQEVVYIPFDRTWPVILLVIGVMLLLSRTASIEGHVQPPWSGGPPAPVPPGTQDPWAGGTVSPTPPTPRPTGPGEQQSPAGQQQNDPQVKP